MIPEMDMRRFLFIRALEETAEPRDVKSKAADAFLAAEADRADADLVRIAVKRSEYVEKDLSRRWGIPLQKIYSRRFSVSAGMVLVVIVISLLLGLSSNYFGGDNINLLINPFLLLLAWNVLVYVLLVVRTIISSTFDIPFAATGRSWMVNAVSALINLITSFFGKYTIERKGVAYETIIKAQPAYSELLLKAFGKLYFRRISLLLHIAAIFFVIGIIGGMYARGLTQFYGVYWESTFIDNPSDVSGFLSLVFWPVTTFFKVSLPPIMEVPTKVYEFGSQWIHFYSFAAIFYVVIPRSFLSIGFAMSIRDKKRNISLEPNDPYIHSLMNRFRGRNVSVRSMLYGYSFTAEKEKSLQEFVAEVYGSQASLDPPEKIEWGTEFTSETIENPGSKIVVFFNGVQTPEDEIHGQFVENLLHWTDKSRRKTTSLVIVDFSDLQKERFRERHELWQSILAKVGVNTFVSVKPGQTLDDSNVMTDALKAIAQEK